MLDEDKMSEAEVSIRLGLFLIKKKLVSSTVDIAIDGAQIQTQNKVHFPIYTFLSENNCIKISTDLTWRGIYKVEDFEYPLKIHSKPGRGDVVTRLRTGHTLRVESKKGSLIKSKSSQEYPLIREALGQLLTIEEYGKNDRLAVAVPNSVKFRELAQRWKKAPLINLLHIGFLLIYRDGTVDDVCQILEI